MYAIIIFLLLSIIVPIGSFFVGEKTAKKFKKILGINILLFFSMLMFSTVFIFTGDASAAQEAENAAASNVQGMSFIAAALSTGLGSIGAGIATASAASAALGALSENESIMGKALIFVGLAEGIAIYGLLISLIILFGV